jgi:hypothetical protein
MIHEERIQAAMRRRPEWAYDEPVAAPKAPVWARLQAWLIARVPRRQTRQPAAPPVLDPASR